MDTLNRRDFLKQAAATSAASLIPASLLGACARPIVLPEEPLNLLLISIDTVNPFHLGCYGYARATSPHLDRFAASSLQFSNALATGAWTIPSYYSLFTGRYPLGVTGLNVTDYLDAPGVRMFQEVLQENGYTTCFSSEENSLVLPRKGFARGFDRVVMAEERFDPSKYSAERILALRDKGRFFAFVYSNDAHDPYEAIPFETNPFIGDAHFRKGVALPVFSDERERSALSRPLEGVPLYEGYYDAQYDAALHFVDRHLGRLFDRLEMEGVYENTAVIVTADHGEIMAAPHHGPDGLYYSHVSPYRENIQVPLLMRIPGVPAGRVETPVQLIDLPPTLLQLAQAPLPHGLQGHSLLPFLTRSADAERGSCYACHAGERYPWGMIQQGPYKFIAGGLSGPGGARQPVSPWPVREIYDLRTDPEERNNLIDTRRDVAADLEARLLSAENRVRESLDVEFDAGGALYEDASQLSPEEIRRMKGLGYL